MKRMLLIIVIILVSGCTQKIPVSRTLFEPIETRPQQVFLDDLGLCIKVDQKQEIFIRHPSGTVGGAGLFQFELYDILKNVTRDAVGRVFNDVYPLCEESANENIHKIMHISLTENDLFFKISFAGNKFDYAKYVAKADITLYENGVILYKTSRNVLGEFEYAGVGGDTATFERAFSRAIVGLIDDIVKDDLFSKHFSRINHSNDIASKLNQIEGLKNKGKITEEEYRQIRQRILDGIY